MQRCPGGRPGAVLQICIACPTHEREQSHLPAKTWEMWRSAIEQGRATRKCPKIVRLSPYSACDNWYDKSKLKFCHIQTDNSPSVGLEGTEVKMPRPRDYTLAIVDAPQSWRAAELHRHEP
jgi:hypothetical protein